MRKIILAVGIAALSAAALSACTPDDDTALQKKVATACTAVAEIHASFGAIAIIANLSQKAIDDEAAIHDGTTAICADPSQVTSQTALATVLNAVADITLKLKSAGGVK